MNALRTPQEQRDQHESEDLALGSTMVLTPEGWEPAEYVPPAAGWARFVDGSYVSPDGSVRSWPLMGTGPE